MLRFFVILLKMKCLISLYIQLHIYSAEFLTYFRLVFHFYTAWKHQEVFWCFLMFSDVFREYRYETLTWNDLSIFFQRRIGHSFFSPPIQFLRKCCECFLESLMQWRPSSGVTKYHIIFLSVVLIIYAHRMKESHSKIICETFRKFISFEIWI